MSGIQDLINEIIASKTVTDADGTSHELHSNVDTSEGQLLQQLISDNDVQAVLEVGCAYGMSSLYIADALSKNDDPRLVIVDPYQSIYWYGVGKSNLEKTGCEFAEFAEEPSELFLPRLIEKDEIFDLAFIDGAHTIEFVYPDFFNVNRLIKANGIVVFDDC